MTREDVGKIDYEVSALIKSNFGGFILPGIIDNAIEEIRGRIYDMIKPLNTEMELRKSKPLTQS